MAVKDVVISNITTPATVLSGSYDFVTFGPNWIIMLTEALDKRLGMSWAYTGVQKAVVSPSGVAYPGDAVVGVGAKKVTVDFLGTPATVVMNQVDNVDITEGWLLITKGDHLIAYSPSIVYTVTVEPSV